MRCTSRDGFDEVELAREDAWLALKSGLGPAARDGSVEGLGRSVDAVLVGIDMGRL
jgi:hypothetical protein